MKNRRNRRVGLVAAMLITMTLILPTGSMADNSITALRRSEVGKMAQDYSPAIKSLERDKINLSQDYLDLTERLKGLQSLYDQLSTYRSLDGVYKSITSPHYLTYIGLISKAANPKNPADPNIVAAGQMIDGADEDPTDVDKDTILDENGINNTAELALAADVAKMTPTQYFQYQGLKSAFKAIGITDPNIGQRKEYETFVQPLEVAPAALQNGASLLGVGIKSASAGIKSGAEALFDGTLQLEGVVKLQKLNREIAEEALVTAEKKHALGQISDGAYQKAKNDARIAALNHQSIQRDYDNLKMNLNALLGREVTSAIALMEEDGPTPDLAPVEAYIAKGLKERSELRNIGFNTSNKEKELVQVEKYLGKSAIEYKRAKGLLEDYALDKAYQEKAITAEIMKAYRNIAVQKQNLTVKKLAKDDALRQQKDMALNVSLGFVTEATAKRIDLLVTQATNEYYAAYRAYESAVAALELSSDIGRAKGGMSGE